MKNSVAILLVIFSVQFSVAQTCTLSGAGTINWDNTTTPSCQEGGTAGSSSIIVVPAGVVLDFNDNDDTWTGNRIQVYGTLQISASGQITINSTVEVMSGGFLNILSKLNLGTTAGCGYTLIINSGGSTNVGNGSSDRLNICGREIARGGGGGCNPYPAGPLPYCEPAGGFTGPTAFDENGYNGLLPVELVYFKITENNAKGISIGWATATEKNFDKFIIERSSDGINFRPIGDQPGLNQNGELKKYSFTDSAPLLGNNYYRLKSLDLDGAFEYSAIVHTKYEGGKKVTIYPNPISGHTLNVYTNFQPSPNDIIQIYDNLGTMVWDFRIFDFETAIDLPPQLNQGNYIFKFSSGNYQQIIRFSVK